MTKSATGKGLQARSAARLSAVQALYQMEIAGTDLNAVIHQFSTLRTHSDDDETVVIAGADLTFFSELLRGVVRRQGDIDPVIDRQLAEGWRLVRVDATVRQILRAALFELIDRPNVPARAVVNEYVEVAKAFFDSDEPKLVNAILDRLARTYRTAEFTATVNKPQATTENGQA
ncbi:MAG: transcription antitermination factor NusB [Pseudomonadota bacterium]